MVSINLEVIRFFKKNEEIIETLMRYEGYRFEDTPAHILKLLREYDLLSGPHFSVTQYKNWKQYKDIYESSLYQLMQEE